MPNQGLKYRNKKGRAAPPADGHAVTEVDQGANV